MAAKHSVFKLGLILMLICLGASFALSFAYKLTKPAIEQQQERARQDALNVVLPMAESFSEPIEHPTQSYWKGFGAAGESEVVGYALVSGARGYDSDIVVMIGVTTDFVIERIKILAQQETPGLGSRVEEVPPASTLKDKVLGVMGLGKQEASQKGPEWPWFQEQFFSKSLDQLVLSQTRGEGVQAITGATITSRAVVKAVREGIENLKKALEESE